MSQNRATMGCSDAIFLGWSTNYSLDVKCALSNGPKTYLWIAHVLKEARGRSSMPLLSGILLVVRSIAVGKDGMIFKWAAYQRNTFDSWMVRFREIRVQ